MISKVVHVKYNVMGVYDFEDDGSISFVRSYIEIKGGLLIQGKLSSDDFIPAQSRIND